jgi:hypothetical protein
METATVLIGVIVWLQVKHFVADYLLQPAWILEGKGHLAKPGGYVHAGLHACGSLPVYVLVGLSATTITALALIEFVVHYAIDHFKAVQSLVRHPPVNTQVFWALHGADQLLHQLTYSGLALAIAYVRP